MASGTPAPPEAAVHSRSAALVLLALLTLVWGAHWVVVKLGLEYLPPLTYATLRLASGLVTMVALLAVQGRLRLPSRSNLPVILSVGLGQVGAGVALQVLALQVVPAGRSAVLVYTMPLWVAAILALVLRTPPSRREAVGLLLGIAGLAALLNPAVIDWQSGVELLGTLALLLNAAIWAVVTIHVGRHRWTQTPLELQPWMLLLALLPMAALATILEPGRPLRWEPATVLVLLYSGPLATAFAFWASQAIVRSLDAQVSAIGFLATPVVGLASGAIVLGEALGPIDVLGFALILGGIGVTSLVLPSRAASRVPAPGEEAPRGSG